MQKYFILLLLFFFFINTSDAQQKQTPKLVVGVVVDQMRAEYLNRFFDQFGDKGFKRLMKEGYQCKDVHFSYIPTYTGPGHASLYSGTTPAFNGIIGNDWFDEGSKRIVNCVSDSTEQIVGIISKSHGTSARKLISTNICDELKIFTQQKAKVISVSLKDRAAVLAAGHMANAAYWFNSDSGRFVSTTYYLKKLPDWALNFNKDTKKYLQNPWKPLLPEASYPMSTSVKPDFSYPMASFSNVYASPYGNTLLTDFAIQVLQNENLGKGSYPDLLAISYSSPDAVGHTYGPLSKELNDLYLRFDADMARLLDALDQAVGKGNYLLFLTADHGVAEVPQYLMEYKVPAGYVNNAGIKTEAENYLNKQLGAGKWIDIEMNEQFYLNRSLIQEKGLKLDDVQNLLAAFLRNQKGIFQVFTATEMETQSFNELLSSMLQAGYMHKRSGDVLYTMEPGWTEQMTYGTTHGSGFSYDTQVPLLFFGSGIHKGETYEYHEITDLAASLALRLGIKLPNACVGKAITGILAN
ncbi:MAG: alkaline phosphatase family protein [Bacteroidota bacterium]